MPSGENDDNDSSGSVPTPAPLPPGAVKEKPRPKLSTTARNGGGGCGGTAATTAAGIGHTIHPKLSLSAKRSVGSAAGGAEMTIVDGVSQHCGVPTGTAKVPNSAGASAAHTNNVSSGGSGKHFKLSIRISDAENGTPIMFKQDGNRFTTSQRTLKLHSNCKYRVSVQCTPPQDFLSLHIGGSDLELVTEGAHSSSAGEYTAMWNTTGIDPSRKGIRQDILFVISGPGKTLNRKLQTKFYAREDSHAGMGHRVEAMCWTCELDPTGQVLVVDEKLL
ncbi:hypothetical protein niasHT_006486 [Heterodera trifolii]|uniref:CB1 cannabinoid receptor-interacting protein 1 n=1 Tax=Heterodera trifolii TaxID=157864 RepID=A0ABD2LTS7_9BILA